MKLIPSFKNLFGIGMSFDIAGTIGFDLAQYLSNGNASLRQLSAEATFRVPQWLSRRISPVEFQTELTAFHRRQDTPRRGPEGGETGSRGCGRGPQPLARGDQ